jgi:hypothetical protein
MIMLGLAKSLFPPQSRDSSFHIMVVNKNMVFEIINSFVGREINKLYCIVIFWFQ